MCDTVFTQQSLLSSHFDQHVGGHRVSVFKCPDCSALYAQKQLMLDHIKVRRRQTLTLTVPFSYTSKITYVALPNNYVTVIRRSPIHGA